MSPFIFFFSFFVSWIALFFESDHKEDTNEHSRYRARLRYSLSKYVSIVIIIFAFYCEVETLFVVSLSSEILDESYAHCFPDQML